MSCTVHLIMICMTIIKYVHAIIRPYSDKQCNYIRSIVLYRYNLWCIISPKFAKTTDVTIYIAHFF